MTIRKGRTKSAVNTSKIAAKLLLLPQSAVLETSTYLAMHLTKSQKKEIRYCWVFKTLTHLEVNCSRHGLFPWWCRGAFEKLFQNLSCLRKLIKVIKCRCRCTCHWWWCCWQWHCKIRFRRIGKDALPTQSDIVHSVPKKTVLSTLGAQLCTHLREAWPWWVYRRGSQQTLSRGQHRMWLWHIKLPGPVASRGPFILCYG